MILLWIPEFLKQYGIKRYKDRKVVKVSLKDRKLDDFELVYFFRRNEKSKKKINLLFGISIFKFLYLRAYSLGKFWANLDHHFHSVEPQPT